MIKNIIFDWTGTIKDSADFHFEMTNKMLEHFGLEKKTS
jgi:beta-phosphoglucomutase-like phosphatase (HAD superfamily)